MRNNLFSKFQFASLVCVPLTNEGIESSSTGTRHPAGKQSESFQEAALASRRYRTLRVDHPGRSLESFTITPSYTYKLLFQKVNHFRET
jgi:hypothetical protein